MIAVDTNILVYAHRAEAAQHDAARQRLAELAIGATPWAIPVFCLGEFLRILTHPRLLDDPHGVADAARALRHLLASPSVVILQPGQRFTSLLLAAIEEAQARGNLIYDAQIVALCREWGVDRLLTEDRDFTRWQGLRLEHLG